MILKYGHILQKKINKQHLKKKLSSNIRQTQKSTDTNRTTQAQNNTDTEQHRHRQNNTGIDRQNNTGTDRTTQTQKNMYTYQKNNTHKQNNTGTEQHKHQTTQTMNKTAATKCYICQNPAMLHKQLYLLKSTFYPKKICSRNNIVT